MGKKELQRPVQIIKKGVAQWNEAGTRRESAPSNRIASLIALLQTEMKETAKIVNFRTKNV